MKNQKYKPKERMINFTHRQYPSVIKRIKKISKKYKITMSDFTRIAEDVELKKAESNEEFIKEVEEELEEVKENE